MHGTYITVEPRNLLDDLSDDELLTRLQGMAAQEKRLGADIVRHLGAVDARELHLALGFSSLYAYVVEQLGFSENVAYKRIKAARAAAECPQILEHLETGRFHFRVLW